MYRYSKRLLWPVGRNELSRQVSLQATTGTSLLDLTSSNPTVCFADYPHTEIQAAFASLSDFVYQPDALGLVSARREITRYYAQRDIPVQEEDVLITASTSEAYALLFKLLCDPGDEVLIPTPSYPLFEFLAALENVKVVPYLLRYDGAWYIDLADLEQRISPRTRAIILVNPNNPTGTYFTLAERDALLQIAGQHRLPLICDEVFMDFGVQARRDVCRSLIGSDDVLSFSLNGLSKSAGMPQVKLAWIVMSGPPADCDTARERLELISDTYLSVSTPAQKALNSLLTIGESFQRKIQSRLRQNLQLIRDLVAETAAHLLHLDGGWSAILQLPKTQSEDQWVLGLLHSHQVLVQPGFFFDMAPEAYIVLSLLTPPVQLQEGLRRIGMHVAHHS